MTDKQDLWRVVSASSKKLGVRNSDGFICFMAEPTRFPDQEARYAQEIQEMVHNAHVIAASPRLLESLKSLIAYIDAGDWSSNRITEIMIAAKNSIADAERAS